MESKDLKSINQWKNVDLFTKLLQFMYRVGQGKFTRLVGYGIKRMQAIFKTKMLIYQPEANLDCVHTMPADFENGEKCDG